MTHRTDDASTLTREGLQAAKKRGQRLGAGPEYPDDLRRRVGEMRASGMTYQSICDQLTAEGIPTAKPGSSWHSSTIWRICDSLRLDAEAEAARAYQEFLGVVGDISADETMEDVLDRWQSALRERYAAESDARFAEYLAKVEAADHHPKQRTQSRRAERDGPRRMRRLVVVAALTMSLVAVTAIAGWADEGDCEMSERSVRGYCPDDPGHDEERREAALAD